MAKTYAQIQNQIRKLQQEADAVQAKEVAGVVARIQVAIAHDGLTAKDRFGQAPVSARPKLAPKAPSKVGKKDTQVAKPTAAAKYQDDAGHQWSGIGKRPNWFKTALASGKTVADLLLQKPSA
jgi:DNA-binding protein H-NS